VSANFHKWAHPKNQSLALQVKGLGMRLMNPSWKNDNVKRSKKGSQGKTYWAVMLKKKKIRSSQDPPCLMV
jgi:hypothetical protein